MDILTAFFIYLLVWWTMLFTVLPLGVQRNEEEGRGFDSGAPKVPDLKKKLLINTILSFLIVAAMWILVEMDVIRWNEWFRRGFE